MQKIFKSYYDPATCRQVGTLSNMRAEIHRTNVNGKVKDNQGYEAHKDFAVLLTRCVCVLSYFHVSD